ncbi:MAG: Uncharacterised protein [Rhodospirillaceae bacterium]|nr:MAG: Uncharacterised protein [Rhodospirillaceae bacterium]
MGRLGNVRRKRGGGNIANGTVGLQLAPGEAVPVLEHHHLFPQQRFAGALSAGIGLDENRHDRGDDLLQRAVDDRMILGQQVGEAAVGEVWADGVAAGVKHGRISGWWALFR